MVCQGAGNEGKNGEECEKGKRFRNSGRGEGDKNFLMLNYFKIYIVLRYFTCLICLIQDFQGL